jgi:hypothetical protein
LVADRLSTLFPFAIAIFLPPAGLILGLAELREDRNLGVRLIAVALLAAVVWVLLLVG